MEDTNYRGTDWEARIQNRDTTTNRDIASEEFGVAALLYGTHSVKETAIVMKSEGLVEILKRTFDPAYCLIKFSWQSFN